MQYYQTLAFGLSGVIAGMTGALMACHNHSIVPEEFGFDMLTAVLAYVVLGGRRSVAGPIVGAVLLSLLPEIARPLADNRMIVAGGLMMLAIIYLPHGIVDTIVIARRRASGLSPPVPALPRLPMAVLSLNKVSRRFGGVFAVQDFSMTARPGRITGLIGPNGAGKTTIVNLITGLLKLAAGSITLDGREIHELPPHEIARRGVARTFQNVRLLKEASVLDNILAGCRQEEAVPFYAQALGLPAMRRARGASIVRAHALLAELGMSEYANRLAGELSYGHQRRVEIMRALALEPGVLLLDEPVAGMNDPEAEELGRIFRKLAAGGMAVLLIEHNIRFVTAQCDEIYVLATGELIDHGAPGKVLANPKVVEAYLGAQPC